MKRLGRRNLLLFALPFILLFFVTLHSSSPLRLEKDNALFSQEVARQIQVGMPESQAEQLLKSSGFAPGIVMAPFSQVGKPSPVAPKRVKFIKNQTTFLRLFPMHAWEVVLVIQDQRVREVQGDYY